MKKTQNNENSFDEQLANFTDSILEKNAAKEDEQPLSSDQELRALEQTALRLKNAYHEEGPSEEVIRRMHKNITRQWQQQKSQRRESFWKNWIPTRQKWQSQRSRQQLLVAMSLVTFVVLMLVCIPYFNGIGPDQPAASGQNGGAGFMVAVLGVILFAIWFFRRKG